MDTTKTRTCPGPLVWFETDMVPAQAVLECATCGYFVSTGNYHDMEHAYTPLMREGLAN